MDILVSLIIIIIISSAIMYIRREKKKGNKCIGCPHGNTCDQKK